jgi:chaperonin cofactor prefoldin
VANKSNVDLWAEVHELRAEIKELREEKRRLSLQLEELQDVHDELESIKERTGCEIKRLKRQLITQKSTSYKKGFAEGKTTR